MTKFLKQVVVDETLCDAMAVAERVARFEIRRAADSSLRECLREIKNLKDQNSRLEREGIDARNAYRYVKATLKDLTNYRVEVSWATVPLQSFMAAASWPSAFPSREGIESPGRSAMHTMKW